MEFTCDECGAPLEFGRDGMCDCGKQLCFSCYEKNGHREHMQNEDEATAAEGE